MDNVSEAKAEFRIRQWTKIVQARQSSGMTVKDWCKQNNISDTAYYCWLRKIRHAACEGNVPIKLQDSQRFIEPAAFHQVKTSASIIIHFPSITVEVNDGASQATIEAVLVALKVIC
ncbi:IS66 family insertion sequence element accessory protein TnpA [Ruminiclostridium cellobioparum]|jgi:hypothetical protein|uniref:IS66 family insertion sequence element accessory protein TnpA n=1 Tax=Ruminiclostridium cellobioparum TaxID=29355 RepID=UPI00048494C0|nr:hypothetical protein [Ruminiclostridium cellobioparum]